MEVFKGKSTLTVDHIDGNKENNSLNNLEYVTAKENNKRSWEMGLRESQRQIISKKVKWNGKTYNSAVELSRSLGMNDAACSNSISKKRKLKGYYAKYI